MNPTLSVIVANYNKEKYLVECLESILNQSYKDLEIIIVDDNSTDGSPDIIKRYAKKYPDIIKTIHLIKNIGVARARHKAILKSKGEYLTTLDSDDYFYNKNKLKMEMELIKNYKKRGKDIIAFSKIVLVNNEGEFLGYQFKKRPLNNGKLFIDIFARSSFMPRDFIFKRSAYFEVGGYDPDFRICEDWDLKIRLANNYEFFSTRVNGTAYRLFIGGLSSIPYKKMMIWQRKVIKKNIHLIKNKDDKVRIKNSNKDLMKIRLINNLKKTIRKNHNRNIVEKIIEIYKEVGTKGLIIFIHKKIFKNGYVVNINL